MNESDRGLQMKMKETKENEKNLKDPDHASIMIDFSACVVQRVCTGIVVDGPAVADFWLVWGRGVGCLDAGAGAGVDLRGAGLGAARFAGEELVVIFLGLRRLKGFCALCFFFVSATISISSSALRF